MEKKCYILVLSRIAKQHMLLYAFRPCKLPWGRAEPLLCFTLQTLKQAFMIPLFVRNLRPLTQFLLQSSTLRSTQTLANSSDLTTTAISISNLLAQGAANWDTLTARFPSLQLTDAFVQNVLLHLKQPMHAKKALTFFHWSSQNQNFRHGLRSYCLIVHILVRAGLLIDARALLESAINKNLASGSARLLVVETLFSTYELTLPGPGVFDLSVQTYAKMRMADVAFDACRYLGDHGFCLSLTSFNAMLSVAQRSGECDFAWKVYEYMTERRLYQNQNTIEIMVDVMCKEGSLRKMTDVLIRIHSKKCSPGVVVNSCLGLRIFQEGRVEKGILLLKRLLQKNLILDDVMCSLIIYGYCKISKLESAYEVYSDMVKRGLGSNAFVHTSFIGAYCKEGKIDDAIRLTEEMLSIGLKPYDETYNFLVEGCTRFGRLEDSLEFYEKMLKQGFLPDCSVCSEITGQLSGAGHVEKASEIITALMDKGFVPNEEIYTKLMDGYGKIGKPQEILKVYYEMQHRGLSLGPLVYASLIINLCECGKRKDAEKFLTVIKRKSVSPDESMFDAMIKGLCEKGEIKWALFFYDEMIRSKLEPCANTFMLLVRSMVKVDIMNKISEDPHKRRDG